MATERRQRYLSPQVASVYRTLRREIEQGTHPAGGRLQPERELVKRFDISRMTLRQAIARLAADGLVEARQGSGTYVAHGLGAGADRVNIISIMYTMDTGVLPQVQAHTLSRGCLLSVFLQTRTQWNPRAERQFLQQVKQQGHRALLAFCSPLKPRNDDLLRELEYSGVRVLHIEHYRKELPDQNYLLPDFRRAGHMTAVALMLAGYREIRLVTYKTSQAPYELLQIDGFGAALTEHRGGFDPESCMLESITAQTPKRMRNTVPNWRPLSAVCRRTAVWRCTTPATPPCWSKPRVPSAFASRKIWESLGSMSPAMMKVSRRWTP